MVIGIDGNEANVQESVGVSVYTGELLEHFAKVAREDLQFIIYLRVPRKKHLPKPTQFFRYKVINAPRLWRDVRFPWYLLTHREIDVLFSPAHYTPLFSPVPVVVAIHDVAYEYFPNEFLKTDLFKLRNWTAYALKHAKKVIAVSQSTRKDIIKIYGTDSKKIKVIYNGFKKYTGLAKQHKRADVLKKYGVKNKEYILYVGTLQPRKNITTLIKAYAKLHAEKPHIKLIIAGKKGWLYQGFYATAQELNLTKEIRFPGYVPNAELVHLYRSAEAYVLPSLYEGFGIPVLEAMNQGCPVIASKASSLPEVGGDACLYFSAHDVNELKNAMLTVINKDNVRKRMIKAGKQQIKKFSSQVMAKQTLEVIKSAVLK